MAAAAEPAAAVPIVIVAMPCPGPPSPSPGPPMGPPCVAILAMPPKLAPLPAMMPPALGPAKPAFCALVNAGGDVAAAHRDTNTHRTQRDRDESTKTRHKQQ